MGDTVNIVWFKRDLRVEDHPALCSGAAGGGLSIGPAAIRCGSSTMSRARGTPRRGFTLSGAARRFTMKTKRLRAQRGAGVENKHASRKPNRERASRRKPPPAQLRLDL